MPRLLGTPVRTSLTVDGNGYLSGIADPAGHAASFSYTPDGLLTGMIDPNGFPHAFAYDAAGRLVRDDDPEGGFISLLRTDNTAASYTVDATTALGRKTSYFLDYLSTGSERRVNTFPTGGRSDSTRGTDARTTTTFPDGTATTVVEGPDPFLHDRNDPGRPRRHDDGDADGLPVQPERPVEPSLPDGHVDLKREDVHERLRQCDATDHVHDPRGRTSLVGIDGQGRVLSVKIAPSIDIVTFAYDGKGRLSRSGQAGKDWTYAYDGLYRLISVSDPLTHSVQYGYDDADRVSEVILPSGRIYGFGYDANGNRTSITMPSGAVHSLGYNKVNLDNANVPPGNPGHATGYNLDREWVRTSLPSGRVIDGAHDNGGRLRDVTYSEGAVALSYFDNTDRVGTLTRSSAVDNQAIAFSYDGFLATRIAFSGVANGEYRYSYNNDFNVTGVALDNVWTSLGRDADGLLTRYGPFTITRNGPAGGPSELTDNVL